MHNRNGGNNLLNSAQRYLISRNPINIKYNRPSENLYNFENQPNNFRKIRSLGLDYDYTKKRNIRLNFDNEQNEYRNNIRSGNLINKNNHNINRNLSRLNNALEELNKNLNNLINTIAKKNINNDPQLRREYQPMSNRINYNPLRRELSALINSGQEIIGGDIINNMNRINNDNDIRISSDNQEINEEQRRIYNGNHEINNIIKTPYNDNLLLESSRGDSSLGIDRYSENDNNINNYQFNNEISRTNDNYILENSQEIKSYSDNNNYNNNQSDNDMIRESNNYNIENSYERGTYSDNNNDDNINSFNRYDVESSQGIERYSEGNNYNNNYNSSLISQNQENMNDLNENSEGYPERSGESVEQNQSLNNLINIEDLPVNVLNKVDNLDENNKNCVICLEDFVIGDRIISLPCIHIFHADCIKNWFIIDKSCPICKYKFNC